MSLLVTGTIGLDTVETPYGRRKDVLGGSAAYFAFAASLLSPVRLVGAVGEDFPQEALDRFTRRRIDTEGLEVRRGAKTFRWGGRYTADMNDRDTLFTELNVVGEDPPPIPRGFRDSKYVFLANTHPAVQLGFLRAVERPALAVCDTMNLWIEETRPALLDTLATVDGVVLNDAEARQLTGESSLVAAGRALLKHGPRFAVIKKGEHGVLLVAKRESPAYGGEARPGELFFALPAFALETVKDPTGAGDSFAGGMMGYLASVDRTDFEALKSAIVRGTCLASIAIEDFSLDALERADAASVARRLGQFRELLSFE